MPLNYGVAFLIHQELGVNSCEGAVGERILDVQYVIII
jgi:hypothetical protein